MLRRVFCCLQRTGSKSSLIPVIDPSSMEKEEESGTVEKLASPAASPTKSPEEKHPRQKSPAKESPLKMALGSPMKTAGGPSPSKVKAEVSDADVSGSTDSKAAPLSPKATELGWDHLRSPTSPPSPKAQPSHVTRAAKAAAEKEEREEREAKRRADVQEAQRRFRAMSREERRSYYRCKNEYVTLESEALVPWRKVAKEHWKEALETPKAKAKVDTVRKDLNAKIRLFRGDITAIEVDAIVNAANKRCVGGGGVDGAIHRAAGEELYEECRLLNGCDEGSAKATCGYALPADWVLHAVGPMGEKPQLLKAAYTACLDLAKDKGLKTIAFPCISTGIFGYPNRPAAEVVCETLRGWLEESENAASLETIVLCLFLEKDVRAYQDALPKHFPLKLV